ncbi:nucleotidyltransferase family protein [Occallatibacter savannae]|uniref:nucleotidyltransferase family protein n=1 Tax=Occallatibacter savannae TaxID=1002691 RepID=UPI001951CA6C|nr:nucleotidyltransferase family protein [Occallatibacter savannae]
MTRKAEHTGPKMNDLKIDLKSVMFSPSAPIRDAAKALDGAGTGALALCHDDGKLVGMLSDGDLRRAVLNGHSLEDACIAIACTRPVIASSPATAAYALQVMNQFDIHQLPVVDEGGVLVDFLLRKDVVEEYQLEVESRDRLRRVCISAQASIADAMAQLNEAGTGALVVCDSENKLRGLIADGDIRRAVIRRIPLSAPCESIATQKPVFASEPISPSDALHMMNEHDIHQLPLVDGEGRIVDFLLRKDLLPQTLPDMQAVVMAGGYGKRLLPLTEKVPKPMLPVGERPLLELIIQQLRKAGIHDVNLTTHYLPESISGHFGNGEHFGVRLNYSREESPLGTAGGLRLMPRPQGPFLVINGDILTGVPFQQMLQYHRAHGAMLTVGVRKYDLQVPFGVVDCDDVRITKIEEKPCHSYFVNAGTYMLEPAAWDRIPEDRRFDMTDLISALLEAGETVVGFPIMEYWIDVGRHEDYVKAQELVSKGAL